MLPLEQELISEHSSVVGITSVEECKNHCSSNKSCSVATISGEQLCYHYIGSDLGIWKSAKIAEGSQWFAKLQDHGTSKCQHNFFIFFRIIQIHRRE
jgi:hypothetical protein